MGLLRSCCCCSLRGGALAVGIVFLSLSVFQFLGVLIGWGAADAIRAIHYRMIKEYPSSNLYYGADHLQGVEILVPMTVLVLVQLVFDSLLVHGVRVSPTQPAIARCYLVAWIIYRAITTGIFSLGALGLLIAAIICRYTGGLEGLSIALGGDFVLVAIIAGLCWYGWVVVLSFYWHLRAANTGGFTYNAVQMQATQMMAPRDAGAAEVANDDHRDGPKFV